MNFNTREKKVPSSTSLPIGVSAKTEAIAKKEKVSKSEVICELVKKGIEEYEKEHSEISIKEAS